MATPLTSCGAAEGAAGQPTCKPAGVQGSSACGWGHPDIPPGKGAQTAGRGHAQVIIFHLTEHWDDTSLRVPRGLVILRSPIHGTRQALAGAAQSLGHGALPGHLPYRYLPPCQPHLHTDNLLTKMDAVWPLARPPTRKTGFPFLPGCLPQEPGPLWAVYREPSAAGNVETAKQLEVPCSLYCHISVIPPGG